MAPVFFHEFFEHLDEKPAVKKAFFDMWAVLSGTPEELVARRETASRAMFQEANTKALDMLKLELKKRRLFTLNIVERFRLLLSGKLPVLDTDPSLSLRPLGRLGLEKHMPSLDLLKKDREAALFQARLLQQQSLIEPDPIQQRELLRESKALMAKAKRGANMIDPDRNPFLALSERPYRLAGRSKAWLQVHVQPILERLLANKLTWEDFGIMLLYERISKGDRKDLGNPLGISYERAMEQGDALMARLSVDQREVMRQSLDSFRAAVKVIAMEAWSVGLYTDAIWESIEKNPAYATFHVIEHMDDEISSRIYEQIGTLKKIRNPGDATTIKAIVTIRAIEHQRVKQIVFDYLEKFHPGEIQDAKVRHLTDHEGRHVEIILDPPKKSGLALVKYFEKGRIKGKYVSQYMAESLENHSAPVWPLVRAVNNHLKAIFTTYRLGFQMSNLRRDFKRFWKNMPRLEQVEYRTLEGGTQIRVATREKMTRRRALKAYWRARHLATVRIWGRASPESSAIRQAWRSAWGRNPTEATETEEQAYRDLIEAEKAGIIATTFSEHLEHNLEAEMIQNILMAAGVRSGVPASEQGKVRGTLAAIKNLGDFIETLPKAAAMYEFRGGEKAIADLPADVRQFIRTKVGSPDFLAGGTVTPWINNFLLFSNAQLQGLRTDFEVATDPTLKGDYWKKTIQSTFIPKLLMKAALLAAAGAGMAASGAGGGDDDDSWLTRKVKRMLSKVPWLVWAGRVLRQIGLYDLTNYIVLPLGHDKAGNAVALRIPQDDSGRLLGGMFWKAIDTMDGDRNFWSSVFDTLDYTAGQMPSVTPPITMGLGAAAYLTGHNIYDPFRQRYLFTDDEQKARLAGANMTKRFLGWELQQMGADVVYKFYSGDERPIRKPRGQVLFRIPAGMPLVGGTEVALTDIPVLGTDIINRYLRTTRYGETERNRLRGAEVENRRAYFREREKKAVNAVIRQQGDALSIGQQKTLATQMARELYPRDATDAKARKAHERSLATRLKSTIVHFEGDALAEPVLGADSNEEKVVIIMEARPNYSPQQFESWLRDAQQKKIISAEVLKSVRSEMARQRLRQPALVGQ
jgi:hypothetical protein